MTVRAHQTARHAAVAKNGSVGRAGLILNPVDFEERYPDTRLEPPTSRCNVGLIEEGIDCAVIRVGEPEDSNLVVSTEILSHHLGRKAVCGRTWLRIKSGAVSQFLDARPTLLIKVCQAAWLDPTQALIASTDRRDHLAST